MDIGVRKKTFSCYAAGLGGLVILALSPLTSAQTVPPVLQPLPPPPAVPLPNPPPTPSWPTEPSPAPSQTQPTVQPTSTTSQTGIIVERTTNTPSISTKPREIEFRAPQANIPLLQTAQPQLYRVEVYGASQLNLTQVRRIAPEAFVRSREGVIQVGVFKEQQRAEELVHKLAMESLWARIVTLGSYASRGQLPR